MNKKLLLTMGTLTAAIAPVATTISCGSKTETPYRTDVGFVVTPDGTIEDGFFSSIWNPIKAAKATTGKNADFIDVNKSGKQHTIDAVNTLIQKGASLIFQPGFMNSETILDNAIANPNVKFIGVAYTKFLSTTKAFTDLAHLHSNDLAFNKTHNLGLIHFKDHQQGFLDGYLAAAKYFNDNPTDGTVAAPVKFSAVSSKAYQDITALMDGFIAGVKVYAGANGKHVQLIAPTTTGAFYTNVTVEKPNFAATMTTAQQYLTTQQVKILMVADPDAVVQFHGHNFVIAGDGKDFHTQFSDVVVSSNKDWTNIATNAIKAAYATNEDFKTKYHNQMHLASYANGELKIEEAHSYPDAALQPAKAAMTKWEAEIKAAIDDPNVDSIYEHKDANGNEDAEGTSKGMMWAPDLVS